MEMFEMPGESDDRPLIVVSPSELDTMRQCPLKHKLLYHERWTVRDRPESHALSFGTLWHKLTEGHYRAIEDQQRKAHEGAGSWRAFDRDTARDRARASVDEVLAGVEDEEVADRLRWMYEGHLAAYGLDDDWQIMAVEHSAEVDLPAPEGFDPEIRFRMKMKMDTVIKWDDRIWVVDRKSCKNLPHNLELDLDDQFGLYIWGMRQLGLKVFGAVHDAARKVRLKTKEAPLDERFKRSPLSRTDKELDRIALEAWQTAYERYSTIQRVVDMRRKGINIDVPRSPNPSQCSWKCDFTEPCIAGRRGASMRDYISRKGFVRDYSRH